MAHADPLHVFLSLPPGTPQPQIQARLQDVHDACDLVTVLDCLFRWELAAGYITRQHLEEVERLSFPDPESGLDLRIQVNFARSRYSASAGGSGRPTSPQLCLLCPDNIGRPGKEQLRVYELMLLPGRRFFIQLTPFPLFPHHFVLILHDHVPQRIDGQSLRDMLAFLDRAPGYTVCSNSDVEWAGSSILNHLHYQAFKDLHLPVLDAGSEPGLDLQAGGCRIELLRYPMSALRFSAVEAQALQRGAEALIGIWKARDPGRNTVNLVLVRGRRDADGDRVRNGAGGPAVEPYRLTVLLRNPDFRTPAHLEAFKREGVGVIEASGEGILPVPEGPEAERLWQQIREQGLAIIKGLIRGNSPGLSAAEVRSLLAELKQKI